MRKLKRIPAPHFKTPPPYNPMTGEKAPLGKKVDLTRCAMMQVCEEDTHDNYLVCRGFDPECEKFFSSIAVAKPYGKRKSGGGDYEVGQVFAAVKPRTLLGDTAGVASSTVGHPADLSEEVGILTDDSGNPVAWLLLDSGGGGGIGIGKLNGALAHDASVEMSVWTAEGGSFSDTGDDIRVYDWLMKTDAEDIASGKKVVYAMIGDTAVVIEAECP